MMAMIEIDERNGRMTSMNEIMDRQKWINDEPFFRRRPAAPVSAECDCKEDKCDGEWKRTNPIEEDAGDGEWNIANVIEDD